MRRAEKIRLAAEAAALAQAMDDRDPAQRDEARKEWGLVRKAAREAYLKKANWNAILNEYKEAEGFYTPEERAKMVSAYTEELIANAIR